MQENIKIASSKEAAEIAERYRRELLSLYRMKNPQSRKEAPVSEPEDTRPLFPEDFEGERIILPPVTEAPMTRPAPPLARPVPLPERIPMGLSAPIQPPEPPTTRPFPPPEENPDSGLRPYEPFSPDGAVLDDAMPGEDSEGFLQLQVTTASEAIPIYDAHITVSRELPNGQKQFRQAMVTDRSGKSPTIALPTPPRELSESPGNSRPYAVYNIFVHKDGFYPVENLNVPVFSGVKSIQPVALVPVEEFSENPDKPQIFYGEEPVL